MAQTLPDEEDVADEERFVAPAAHGLQPTGMRMRTASFLILVLACLAASGCSAYYTVCKLVGGCHAGPFDPNKEIPEDFRMSLDVHDVLDPPTDYVIQFARDGKSSYDVTVRSPRRKQQSGDFEITEDQIRGLWKAVAAAHFDKLDERYPKDGEGPDKKNGVQKFYVYADNTERRVESRFQTNEALESIRKAAVAIVPPDVMKGTFRGPSTQPKEFVADMATHLFHLPDCPKLKDVPPANRQPFASQFDALNYGFRPCPDCQPIPTNTK
jgi:hypothetical protein